MVYLNQLDFLQICHLQALFRFINSQSAANESSVMQREQIAQSVAFVPAELYLQDYLCKRLYFPSIEQNSIVMGVKVVGPIARKT